MARTRLFARVEQAMRLARRTQGILVPRALTRRQALVLGAASLAAACASTASKKDDNGPIAIIGGGAAGLTVAYRLAKARRRVTVYESSARFGGRMFTRRNFTAEGQFCELGGELVDSNHENLIALASELGVGIQRLVAEDDPGGDLYDIGGKLRSPRDMLDPATGTGAFLPLAAKIAEDQAALLDADENWTPRARELDAMTLKAYLDALRPLTQGWAVDLVDLAYLGEYGQPTERQSALNLVDFIGVDPTRPFEVFGESDEAHRIAGGSSSLIEALIAALEGKATLKARHALYNIVRDGARLRMTFEAPDGLLDEVYDEVVLALPFTRLRKVEGLAELGLTPEKLSAINDLGYGNNAKLMVATTSRPWTSGKASFRAALYSDRGFQCVWETSRGQEGAGGILTNFMAGARADGDEKGTLASLAAGLAAISPAFGSSLDPETRASFFWGRYPHMLGSYASPRTGQYTTMLEAAPMPELNGRLHFAGEHTSADFLGYMNGAVESGERVAREILA
jgi:monoamine oxidase